MSDRDGFGPEITAVLNHHEPPEKCPTCGIDYDKVITTTGRYSTAPIDSQAVLLHVVRNLQPKDDWDVAIYLHETPSLTWGDES